MFCDKCGKLGGRCGLLEVKTPKIKQNSSFIGGKVGGKGGKPRFNNAIIHIGYVNHYDVYDV